MSRTRPWRLPCWTNTLRCSTSPDCRRHFFDGYGQPPTEPNTSLHRVVQTLDWATGSDWAEFEADPTLPAEITQRTRDWLRVLVNYLGDLPAHLDRLRTLTDTRS